MRIVTCARIALIVGQLALGFDVISWRRDSPKLSLRRYGGSLSEEQHFLKLEDASLEGNGHCMSPISGIQLSKDRFEMVLYRVL